MKLDHYLTSYTKLSSKWIKDSIVTTKIIKFLEENTSGKLLDIGLGNDFLSLTPKATKAKVNKYGYIKLKSLCTAKKIINRMKRQPNE